MANHRKWSYISLALPALSALLVVFSGAGCKQPVVPSDDSVIKSYKDNRKIYQQVVEAVMAEANQKFEVEPSGGIKYNGENKPVVTDAGKRACQQLMSRSFCRLVRRDVSVVYFVFSEELNHEHFRLKALVYDQDNFKAPIWTSKVSETDNLRFVPIEPNWQLEYKYEVLKH